MLNVFCQYLNFLILLQKVELISHTYSLHYTANKTKGWTLSIFVYELMCEDNWKLSVILFF